MSTSKNDHMATASLRELKLEKHNFAYLDSRLYKDNGMEVEVDHRITKCNNNIIVGFFYPLLKVRRINKG